MKNTPAPEPYSIQELEIVERFIREQASVVMRAARMEVALHPAPPPVAAWRCWLMPWAAIQSLQATVQQHEFGSKLQLLLERHLIEALTYLNDPSETHRDILVAASFSTLYRCEEYRFGEKAAQHIAGLIDKLGLQNYP